MKKRRRRATVPPQKKPAVQLPAMCTHGDKPETCSQCWSATTRTVTHARGRILVDGVDKRTFQPTTEGFHAKPRGRPKKAAVLAAAATDSAEADPDLDE